MGISTAALDKEFEQVFAEILTLVKMGETGELLADRGVNTSLVMLGLDGLRAYIAGEKLKAAEDFETLAEELRIRSAASREA